MLIRHSIIAGRILSLLEKTKRSVSFEELQDYLKESMEAVRSGAQILIREGLAIIDMEDSFPKITLIPALDGEQALKQNSFYYSSLLKKGGSL